MCKMALKNKRFIALDKPQLEMQQPAPAPARRFNWAGAHNQLIQ